MIHTITGYPKEIFRELSDMAWNAAIARADGQEARSVEAYTRMFGDRLAEPLGLQATPKDELADDTE